MTRKQMLLGITLGLLWTGAALADPPHAVQAGTKTTFTGEITQVEWKNPHVYFHVRTRDDSGRNVDWTIEAWSIPAFIRGGLRRDMFEPGERVTVYGRAYAQPERNFLRLEAITRHPDRD